jgi:hypothetical protein
MSTRSRDARKMITIGSLGTAPHIREIYSYRRCLSFLFILPKSYSPNGNSHLNHNASVNADFLKQVLVFGAEIGKENFKGNIWFTDKIATDKCAPTKSLIDYRQNRADKCATDICARSYKMASSTNCSQGQYVCRPTDL